MSGENQTPSNDSWNIKKPNLSGLAQHLNIKNVVIAGLVGAVGVLLFKPDVAEQAQQMAAETKDYVVDTVSFEEQIAPGTKVQVAEMVAAGVDKAGPAEDGKMVIKDSTGQPMLYLDYNDRANVVCPELTAYRIVDTNQLQVSSSCLFDLSGLPILE